MRHIGTARLDKRTKDLVKRLGSDDIAIIDHVDIDRVSAESLLQTGVEAIVNVSPSISGAYPNTGPLLLTRGGVTLIDNVGPEVFERVREGDTVSIVDGDVFVDSQVVASGSRLTVEAVEQAMEQAKSRLEEQLDAVAARLEEIAGLTASSVETVKSRLRYAYRRLRAVLEDKP